MSQSIDGQVRDLGLDLAASRPLRCAALSSPPFPPPSPCPRTQRPHTRLAPPPESPIEVAIGDGDVACKRFLARRRCRDVLVAIFRGRAFQVDSRVRNADEQHVEEELERMKQYMAHSLRERTTKQQHTASSARRELERDEEYFEQRAEHLCEGGKGVTLPLIGDIYLPTDFLQRPWRVLTVPKVKYIVHTISSAAYLCLLVAVLTGLPPWTGVNEWMHQFGRFQPATLSWAEVCLWAWTCCRVVEEAKQFVLIGMDEYHRSERVSSCFAYLYDESNLLDVFNYSCVLCAAMLRMACRNITNGNLLAFAPSAEEALSVERMISWTHIVYAISSITFFLRWVTVLCVYEHFGILYLVMRRMLADISQWFGITFFISFGFAVACALPSPLTQARGREARGAAEGGG